MALPIEQIAEKVMQRLVKRKGEVEADDLQNVTDAYDCIYQQLKDDSLVTWSETDDIPTRFTLPVILIISSELGPYYDAPEPRIGWEKTKLIATNTIRRQLATGQDHEPVAAEYF